MIVVVFFFFFSSRRRHTRFDCDWSSDVCSSDLVPTPAWIICSGGSVAAAGAVAPARCRNCSSACASAAPAGAAVRWASSRSEEHTSELQSQSNLVCRLLLEKKKQERVKHLLHSDVHHV